MNKLRASIFILFIAVLSVQFLYSETRLTQYSLTGSINGGINLYSTDFSALPGVVNCCTKFTGGNGFGWSASIGISYLFNKFPLVSRSNFDSEVFFKNYSGSLSEETAFGNIIIGNSYVKGISRHLIEATIGIAGIEESLTLYPIAKLPLGIRLGVFGGIPVMSSFSQKEILLQPADVKFENGTRERNQKSGELPNKSTFFGGINASLKYELFDVSGMKISSLMSYELLFPSIIKDLKWNAQSAKFGLSISRRIKKAKTLPPPPPPVPDIPPPPPPAILALDLDVSLKEQLVKDGDTVEFSFSETVYRKSNPILPYLFYTENSVDPIMPDKSKIRHLSDYQLYAFNALTEYLLKNRDVKALIEFSLSESDTKKDEKVKSLIEGLVSAGIDRERLESKINSFNPDKIKHRELVEDLQYARFILSDGTGVLYYSYDSSRVVQAEKLDFDIKLNAVSSAEPIVYNGSIEHRGAKIFNFTEKNAVYTIQENNIMNSDLPDRNKLTFKADVRDAEGNNKSLEKTIFIHPKNIKSTVIENLVQLEADSGMTIEYLLGFFEFDAEGFSYVNSNALKIIKENAAAGNRIEIIPLTDSLGDNPYNRVLAQRRAKAALNIIDEENMNYKVTLPEEYFFNNSNVFGRMYNRSVIVRIKN